jgi:hypothetical protein
LQWTGGARKARGSLWAVPVAREAVPIKLASSTKEGTASPDDQLWEADSKLTWLVPALPPISSLLIASTPAGAIETSQSKIQSQFTILFPDEVDVSAVQLTTALEAVEQLSALLSQVEGSHPEAVFIGSLDSGSRKILQLGSKAGSGLLKAAKLLSDVAFKLALLPQRQATAQIEAISKGTEAVVEIEGQVQKGVLTRQQGDSLCAAVHATLFKYFGTGATVPGAERTAEVLALPEPEPQKLLEGPKSNDNQEPPEEEVRTKARRYKIQPKRRPKRKR